MSDASVAIEHATIAIAPSLSGVDALAKMTPNKMKSESAVFFVNLIFINVYGSIEMALQ